MRSRGVRGVHRPDRRRAALFVLGADAHDARQESADHRRARRSRHRQTERGAAGRHRRTGLPMRVLHARLRDGRDRLPQDQSEPDAPGTGARGLRQSVPLPGLQQDSHRADEGRRAREERVMADNKLIGQDYTTPDLVAKVTGKAKYAEDYRVEGMLFAKLLCSTHPHAKVTFDTSAAQAMPGVKAILTADEMHGAAVGATLGEGVQASAQAERGLTNEPLYQGEPILAVAAIDEHTAALAIEAIDIEFEPLPFVVDPIESLRRNGANARTQGNVWARPAAPPAAPGARGPANDARGANAAGTGAAGAAAGAASGGGQAAGQRAAAADGASSSARAGAAPAEGARA